MWKWKIDKYEENKNSSIVILKINQATNSIPYLICPEKGTSERGGKGQT